jgi:phage terminase large subunit GpA-like protein
MSTPGKVALGKPTKQDINRRQQTIKGGAQLWPVGSDTIKSLIHGRLRNTEPGPGTYHWPIGLAADYWSQLTAEKQVVRMVNGFPKRVWVKRDGDRNEALDCEAYAYAALQYVYTRHNRATLWAQMASRLGTGAPDEAESAGESPSAVIPPGGGRISLDGWGRK